jgi:hypothetical protein
METTKYNLEEVTSLLAGVLSDSDRDALEAREWYLGLSEDLPSMAFRPDGSFYLASDIWVLPTGKTYHD